MTGAIGDGHRCAAGRRGISWLLDTVAMGTPGPDPGWPGICPPVRRRNAGDALSWPAGPCGTFRCSNVLHGVTGDPVVSVRADLGGRRRTGGRAWYQILTVRFNPTSHTSPPSTAGCGEPGPRPATGADRHDQPRTAWRYAGCRGSPAARLPGNCRWSFLSKSSMTGQAW